MPVALRFTDPDFGATIVLCRSGGMADALRSGRSVRKGVGVQISPSALKLFGALVAQLDRAQPCGG